MTTPSVTRRTALKALGATALVPFLSDEGLSAYADIQAKKAPPRLKVLKVAEPKTREAGIKVDSVAALVDKLKNEAGVL